MPYPPQLVEPMRRELTSLGVTELLTAEDREALPGPVEADALPDAGETSIKNRAITQARQDIEKTSNLVKSWVNEGP